MSPQDTILKATDKLSRQLSRLKFGEPVTHVYNPLVYAKDPHTKYINKYAKGRKRVLFLGMNPGPFGMAQTGIPFGEIDHAANFLKVRGVVKQPKNQHPKRPIQGFDCPRSEVSGRRLWGSFGEHFGSASRFFKEHFVANYCPLVFMETSGKNRTPDKLAKEEREQLFKYCDQYLELVVNTLEPEYVVGVGRFAKDRAAAVLESHDVTIAQILHPSPASPWANKDWWGTVQKQMKAQNIWPA
ncbi:MAG: single-stranded DNA-binding protein [Myxococcales bacterium]|nr:single-stranded DNA-binding protein [Myxococcales bacterium]|tara:strand:+ start:921 stop:1646 length:726 start_codon:yes stop_codon:yes gene_type:complete